MNKQLATCIYITCIFIYSNLHKYIIFQEFIYLFIYFKYFFVFRIFTYLLEIIVKKCYQ
jgi:hypothetical protein